MVVTHYGNQQYYGLSTDTKPTPADTATKATFGETDTHNEYINNGSAWILYRAPSKTETFTNKTLDTDSSNKLITRHPSEYIVYRTSASGPVKAYNTMTGVVDYSDANGYIDNVLNPLFATGGNYTTAYVSDALSFGAKYPISPTSTGIQLNYKCHLKMEKNTRIEVPQGWDGSLLKSNRTTANGLRGGSLNVSGGILAEQGTPQNLWTAIHLYNEVTAAGLDFSTFENISIETPGTVIKLETNHPTSCWMNGNSFLNLTITSPVKTVEFLDRQHTAGSYSSGAHRNFFQNIKSQTAGMTEAGITDIQGNSNTFINVTIWDLHVGQPGAFSSNVGADANTTVMIGGALAHWNFVDLGYNTIIIDHTQTQIGSLTLTDSKNLILGTGTGTKIGTATTQKLGFYNKTPIVQPTAITSPTLTTPTANETALKTAVDAIRTRLTSLGLTA